MPDWNWSAIATIGTLIIAFGVLWNAIGNVGKEVRAVETGLRGEITAVRDDLNDLSQRVTRVETILEERLPRRQEQTEVRVPPQDVVPTAAQAE